MKLWLVLLMALMGMGCLSSQTRQAELADFVSLSLAGEAFAIGKYPVTNGQYQAFLKANPKARAPKYWSNGTYPEGKEKHPVVYVSYEEVQAYCAWLETRHPGYTFRLPTMAEWEFAAGGEDGRAYPWATRLHVRTLTLMRMWLPII